MRALVAATLVLLAPMALAQEHTHEGDVGIAAVIADGPTNGRAVVGAFTHFGFALLDADGFPLPHQNAQFVVTQGARTIFSTTDTHEYDGLFSFDVVFHETGPYQVVAMSGDLQMGVFEGEVIEPVNESVATIEFAAAPAGPPASRVVEVTLGIVDEAGVILSHTDALVEFRERASGALASRMRFHIHDEPIVFRQALGPATQYTAHVVAYKSFATGRDPDVRAIAAEFPIDVGPVFTPVPPMPELAPPRLLEQLGAASEEDGFLLQATYDPNNQVGVGQTARIGAVIVNLSGHMPFAHVDFDVLLNGPRGVVFESASIHEYDGVLEYLFVPELPGAYDGRITATWGDHQLTVPVHLVVVPPAIPLAGIGPMQLSIDGLDAIVAGKEANLTFRAMGPAGPAAHSEVDVTIFHEGEAPLYQFKLHTHDSGLTNAVLVFPHEGEWSIRLDGLPTVPEPSTFMPTLLTVNVAAPVPGAMQGEIDAATKTAEVPAIGVVFVLAAVFAMAGVVRRR